MQENVLDEQEANDQAIRILNSENSSDEAHSSNFSFGIKGNSTNIIPTPITYPMQVAAIKDKPTEEIGQVQQQRKDQPVQLKQSKGKELQIGNSVTKMNTQSLAANTVAQSHNVINEHISMTFEVSKQVQNQGHKDKEGKQDQLKEINQQGGKNRIHDNIDRGNMDYHNNFPKISNNYTRYVSNPQRNRDDASKVNNDTAQNNGKQQNGTTKQRYCWDRTNKGKSDHEVQTIEGSRDDESNHTTTNVLKDHVTDNGYNKTSCIDLSLPLPHSPNVIYVDAENSDEVCGGMDGGCQEKTTNFQEGATKGGNLTHVLHEGAHNDLNSDLRTSATTTQNYAKTVHQVQEIQKAALAQDTSQGGHNQVDSTVDQVRAPKEYKQQKGQGAATETNSKTQKKKGTAGIEGTQEYNTTEEETGEKTPINIQNKGRTQDNIATDKQGKERDLSLKTNNKSQGRLSKKKRDTIKKKIQKEASIQDTNKNRAREQNEQIQQKHKGDYYMVHSEDEYDEDTQSIEGEEEDEDGEEVSAHLIKTFASTFQSEFRKDIQENVVEEAVGGMAGRIQETATNVQEGVPKGRGELPHVVHEVVVDLSSDYRGLNTPISIHKTTGQQGDIDTGQQKDKFNNKSEGRLSKKRRDTIKKRQNSDQVSDNGPHTEDQDVNKGRHYRPPQDDYGALNSEDELDSDNQSIDESDEEEEDNNNQPPHTFGSTFKDKWPEEVHELTAKQGLSPRGREQSRQTKQQTISTSANSGRPITRSKSKGC
uniref:TPR Domain containing protein n=1 Tax=Solanum tuberosum TaxID=4113 RepID=M1DDE1_SOLTU